MHVHVAGPVTIWIGDRQTTMDCVVGPPKSEPVVGSTVLAAVDLVADEATGMDAAVQPRDVDLPGYRLHPLTGDRRGQWSVRVSGNWRIVFRFVSGEAVDVTLVDYH